MFLTRYGLKRGYSSSLELYNSNSILTSYEDKTVLYMAQRRHAVVKEYDANQTRDLMQLTRSPSQMIPEGKEDMTDDYR
ncbi:hypothetical protein HNY73_016811 [Argiope bruennichi]|uniref:Uncharacterized protein n=1 Tax=Argiope bruennichi TaxID=94029 RepID=A0A8T0ENJ1_ARGBR|nr:hypothetical protein HNY73_016811 [Argiope bruennichi]